MRTWNLFVVEGDINLVAVAMSARREEDAEATTAIGSVQQVGDATAILGAANYHFKVSCSGVRSIN